MRESCDKAFAVQRGKAVPWQGGVLTFHLFVSRCQPMIRPSARHLEKAGQSLSSRYQQNQISHEPPVLVCVSL